MSAEKRRQSAERKSKSILNNSATKALYSFSKEQRFPARMYRSVTDMRFYNIEVKKYNKRVSFSSSKRSDLSKDNGVPGPTRYNTGTFSDKRLLVQFKAGREECKANSVFQRNQNPGPGNYDPKEEKKYKTVFYSLAKKIEIKQPLGKESPGPIYSIDSTLLDQNKHLSIYIKRNSTKICKPRTCFPLKKRQTTEPISSLKQKQLPNDSFITNKGGKVFGKEGPYATQSSSKRLFQCEIKQTSPGPGQYNTFSEFVDGDVRAC